MRRTISSNVKLSFEDFLIEAGLNSRPLVPISNNDDGVEVLTPGYFLIGRPLESLPGPPLACKQMSLLRRWHLCQNAIRHFWKRWSNDYLASLRKFYKWHNSSRNACVGDVILLQEDGLNPTKWQLGKLIQIHPCRQTIKFEL